MTGVQKGRKFFFFLICVCASCSMTTQQPYTKDESFHLISPTNSPFLHPLPLLPPSIPPSIHAPPAGLAHGTEQITDNGEPQLPPPVQRLRRFNFLLFIVATQTTFKLLPFRPVPLPSRPNLRLTRPKIFTAQQSPDDLPSLKSG